MCEKRFQRMRRNQCNFNSWRISKHFSGQFISEVVIQGTGEIKAWASTNKRIAGVLWFGNSRKHGNCTFSHCCFGCKSDLKAGLGIIAMQVGATRLRHPHAAAICIKAAKRSAGLAWCNHTQLTHYPASIRLEATYSKSAASQIIHCMKVS